MRGLRKISRDLTDGGTPDSNAFCQACFDMQDNGDLLENQADPHCLANQNKLSNRHWGLGVPPSVNAMAKCFLQLHVTEGFSRANIFSFLKWLRHHL